MQYETPGGGSGSTGACRQRAGIRRNTEDRADPAVPSGRANIPNITPKLPDGRWPFRGKGTSNTQFRKMTRTEH